MVEPLPHRWASRTGRKAGEPQSRNVDEAVLPGASWTDRRIAQACNGGLQGRCGEAKCRSCPRSGQCSKLEAKQRVGKTLWNFGLPKADEGGNPPFVRVCDPSRLGEVAAY